MRRAFLVVVALSIATSLHAGWKVIAWNDLGMHCTDGTDYSVYGILPPYNTIHAQVIDPNGRLVRDGSVAVTYEAVADANGSINTTSANKTNFWTYANAIFGASPAPDMGLAGSAMPGPANTPRPMTFDANALWYTAEGIPITPYDDGGAKNTYPLMRVVARDKSGTQLASTNVVLPVSDEMDCRTCHGPAGAAIGSKETKLDILRIHDARNDGTPAYADALARAGYKSEGLLATSQSGNPILCARCHASNALPGTGLAGIAPLTQAIHSSHASFLPDHTRDACYRCHPGATTQCLRGAMGRTVQANGELAIQCQNCHGGMSAVGAPRTGWLDEPSCQSCHSGNALANGGAIRFSDVFASPGQPRTPANPIFATSANVPASGFSLFRFSRGHGGLYCEACHGSTHAELPSSHDNDNVQSIALQGHAGVIAECTACHGTTPSSATGGPHGMHPVGASWVSAHGDIAEHNTSQCQACHGSDLRGTVLTRALGSRTVNAFGARTFWRGYQIGCYACHNGPGSESATKMRPPSVTNATAMTQRNLAANVALSATDPAGYALTLRVVDAPKHGTAGIDGTRATYLPAPGFVGSDSFTFAAWNGYVESQLATVTVNVGAAGGKRRVVRR